MQNTNIQDYKIIIIDVDSQYGEAFAAEASRTWLSRRLF